MPVKGAPTKAFQTVFNLSGMAAHPESVEYIFILDKDDPTYREWRFAVNALNIAGLSAFVIRGESQGYGQLHKLYGDGYNHSRGEFLWAINDDIRVTTFGWDNAYCEALHEIPCGAASANLYETAVTLDGSVGQYGWAFPFFRRDLALVAGDLLWNSGTVDRVIDAYAHLTGYCKGAPVDIRHEREFLVEGTPRWQIYNYYATNWEKYKAQWGEVAQEIYRKIREGK
jgi:hypothetical protein